MDADAVVTEKPLVDLDSAARTCLVNLEALLRVIRIPRPDVAAMLAQLPPDIDELLAATDPVAEALAPYGWLVFDGAPRGVYESAAETADACPSGDDSHARLERETVIDDILAGYWNVSPARFDGILNGVRRIYAPTEAAPHLAEIRDGRLALLEEALASHADGRYASAITVAITQFDGIAADVPPTPGAAFPFLVSDERDHAAADPLITGELIVSHPGTVALVSRLMRTGRPDTNLGEGLHRHGIMHGRDLRFGTRANSTKVLIILLALVQWAEPLARARA